MSMKKSGKMSASLKEKIFARAKKRMEEKNRTGRTYLNYDGPIMELKKENKFDILLYQVTDPKHPDKVEPGELWYQRPIKVHRSVGTDNIDVLCPASIGKKCPICSYVNGLRTNYQENKEEIAALRAKDRVIYPVYNYLEKEESKRYALLDVSTFLFGNLLDEEVLEDESLARFPELEEGLTLKVRCREKKFGDRTFFEASTIMFTERSRPHSQKEVLKRIPKIDDLLQWKSYEEIERIFYEDESSGGSSAELDVDVWNAPISKVRSLASTFGIDPDDYSDDDDLRDAVALALEEGHAQEGKKGKQKPKPMKRKPESPPADEDEDELADEDEDEDEDESADEDEDEDEPTEVKKDLRPMKAMEKPKTTAQSSKTQECPHGGRFGITVDELDECESCKIWDSCFNAMAKK